MSDAKSEVKQATVTSKTLIDEARLRMTKLMAPHAECGHGPEHCEAVFQHTRRALEACDPRLTPEQETVLQLAALLHDVDDPKLFATPNYNNVWIILTEIGVGDEDVMRSVVEVISLVSCSTNGNSALPPDQQRKLIVRAADRLEAIGQIGVDRCLAFAKHKNLPLFVDGKTQFATSESELDKIATRERFEVYAKGGKSESVLDHFYDKLCHLDDMGVKNTYIQSEAAARMKIIRAFAIQISKTCAADTTHV